MSLRVRTKIKICLKFILTYVAFVKGNFRKSFPPQNICLFFSKPEQRKFLRRDTSKIRKIVCFLYTWCFGIYSY